MADVEPSACECEVCRGYCETRPGYFAPGQIEQTVEHLRASHPRMTVQSFFKAWLVAEKPPLADFMILVPASSGNESGKVDGRGTGLGRCIFLTSWGQCAIHDRGRPLECQLAHHDHEDIAQAIHDEIGMSWDTPENQQLIEALLKGDKNE